MIEVDVLPAQRLELPATKAGVEGGRPDCAVALGDGGYERIGLGGTGDAVASPSDCRQ